MYAPDYETFEKLSREGNLIPLYREILADIETPVSVFTKLRDPMPFCWKAWRGAKSGGVTPSSGRTPA